MPETAANSHVLIAGATHGATVLGLVRGYRIGEDVAFLELSNEASIGPDVLSKIRHAGRCTLRFAVGPAVAPGTKADLTITDLKSDATTEEDIVLNDCRAGSWEKVHEEKGEAIYEQEFLYEGSAATAPVTQP